MVGEIHLFSKVRYGRSKKNVPVYKFVPLKPSTLQPCKVATTYGTTHGESRNVYAVAECKGDRATVVEILGPTNDPEAGFKAIQYRHLGYTGRTRSAKRQKAVLESAPMGMGAACQRAAGGPRPSILCTIDPPGCRDIDDAVSFAQLEGGQCVVGVHIADVSAFVQPDGELDAWYRAQPCSLYRPDGVVLHSLPEALSAGCCSIVADEPRRAVSVRFTLDDDGAVVSTQVACETIVSRGQLSYEHADSLLQTDPTWAEFALAVRLWRKAVGGADTTAAALEEIDSHELIAFLMIRANAYIASALLKTRGPVLLRAHRGVVSGNGDRSAASRLDTLRAEYVNTCEPTPHVALGLPAYTHFTSPIRRYADLHVHRLVKLRLIDGGMKRGEEAEHLAAEQADGPAVSPEELNAFMERQSRIDSEWAWWWEVGCLCKPDGAAQRLPPQQQRGEVLKWSVSHTFGVSVYVWLDAVQRGAWVRVVHPELMGAVDCAAADDGSSLVLSKASGAPPVTFRPSDGVELKWWWDYSRGVRGLRFQWITPSLSDFLG